MIGQGAVRKESRARIRPRYSVVLSYAARPDLPALPGSSEDRVEEGDSLLSGAVLARLLCAFCKQLAEKLDAVRQAAGDSLARLLQALTQARAPAAPFPRSTRQPSSATTGTDTPRRMRLRQDDNEAICCLTLTKNTTCYVQNAIYAGVHNIVALLKRLHHRCIYVA